jgi:hypothetical protein
MLFLSWRKDCGVCPSDLRKLLSPAGCGGPRKRCRQSELLEVPGDDLSTVINIANVIKHPRGGTRVIPGKYRKYKLGGPESCDIVEFRVRSFITTLIA